MREKRRRGRGDGPKAPIRRPVRQRRVCVLYSAPLCNVAAQLSAQLGQDSRGADTPASRASAVGQVPVVVLRSDAHAELVGTRDHPVLVDGVWMELEEAVVGGLLRDFNGTLETRHVESFFNLEVDGHMPGQSTHSYVVNGLVASGNGDSPVLNARFPRQKAWQAKTAEAGCAADAPLAIPMAAAARGLMTAGSWEMAF